MNYYGDYVSDPGGQADPAALPPPQLEPQDYIFMYPQNMDHALSLIRNAVAGETEDRIFYSYLIEMAPSAEDKQIIAGIRDNEMNHHRLFRQIYFQLTRTQAPPAPEAQFVPPATYCDGLQRALLGEQNAVQNYRQILYAMYGRVQINMVTEIITDEIRHAILYNYLYAKNGCRS